MKLSTEELSKTFKINVDEPNNFIELKYIKADVGNENVDIQSDLVYKEILIIYKKFPDKKNWNILVDTATTKVSSMTKYSMKKYQDLISQGNFRRIAILMDNTEKQHLITSFVLKTISKLNKKICLFTTREEAEIWLKI